jgi:hypothetical protein
MKKLNFLALLVAIAFVSCAKSDAPTPTGTAVAQTSPVDVAAIIVGSWKLSLVGTLMPSTNTGGGGCGGADHSSENKEIAWTTTGEDELISFAKNGAFVQIKQAKQVCKGTYQLNIGAGTLSNDCSSESRNFSNVSDKSLTLDDGQNYYRFDKVSSNPQ